jgi:hypothetical protein
MLDDLRKSVSEQYDSEVERESVVIVEPAKRERTFLGMTAVERMFLAIFFFLNVLIIGLVLLLATGRIVL